ncbi:MAG TPA: GNAT family N-acetyltransferase [Polyangiaceae bacterium]|nr:GNAT family N-acetyltransferase [Polyangiaceae bacterium]
MRLAIIPKAHLSLAQLREATQRIFAPEHAGDVGPRYFWNRPAHDRHHFALFDLATEEFVGTVYCVITPPVAQDFTWWLDARVRKQGYWHALADDLAAYLKKRHGIQKVGLIVFGGSHLDASRKIAQRLRSHFDSAAASGEKRARST